MERMELYGPLYRAELKIIDKASGVILSDRDSGPYSDEQCVQLVANPCYTTSLDIKVKKGK